MAVVVVVVDLHLLLRWYSVAAAAAVPAGLGGAVSAWLVIVGVARFAFVVGVTQLGVVDQLALPMPLAIAVAVANGPVTAHVAPVNELNSVAVVVDLANEPNFAVVVVVVFVVAAVVVVAFGAFQVAAFPLQYFALHHWRQYY